VGLHYNRISIPARFRASAKAHRESANALNVPFMPMLRSTHLLRELPTRLLLLACLVFASGARAQDLSEVQRLYYSGQAAAAMQRADQFLALNPRDPQMRFMKGVMLADNKRDAEAIALFQKLTEDYPDLAEPYNNLAALYAAGGDYSKARTTLEQAIRTNPSYATAHENLGDVYAALAAQSYNRALRLDPRNVTVPPKLALVREMYKLHAAGAAAPPSSAASGAPLSAVPASSPVR
jgi:tetratricopeptide (TPR) repeat protein